MATYPVDQGTGRTAEKIDVRFLLSVTPSTFHQSTVALALGRATAGSWTIRVKPQRLRVEELREATEEEAWAAYKRIEPRYSRTNRLLANL